MELEQLEFLEQQMEKLERETAQSLQGYSAVVERLAAVPGLGVAAFSRSSFAGCCPA